MERSKLIAIWLVWSQITILPITSLKTGQINLVNVSCDSLDVTFVKVLKCELTRAKNNLVTWNYEAHLQKEREGLKVHAKLFRWEQHKYQPFIYDDHIDVCDFLDNAKRQVFWGLIYDTIKKFSNFNHSCPLDGKLFITNFVFDSRQFRMVPLPRGKYLLDFIVSTHRAPRFRLQLFAVKT